MNCISGWSEEAVKEFKYMAWREELSPSFCLSTNHPADQNESVVEKISGFEIATSAVSNENNKNAGAPGAGPEPVRTARDFG